MNEKSPPSKLFHNQNQNLDRIRYSSPEHSVKKSHEHQSHSKQRKFNLTRSIASFEIAKQINHRISREKYFNDYICIKNQSYSNRKNKIQHFSSKKDDQSVSKSFYYLAKIFGNQKLTRQAQEMHINLMKQFLSQKEKIVDQERLKNLIVLSPDQLNLRIRQTDQVYIQICLQKHFKPIQQYSFICLDSLEGLRNQEKSSSELYCLNLFYLFSLKVINPLVFLSKRILIEQKCKLESLIAFLSLILVKQNIVYEKKSQQFFLFFVFRCTSHRGIHSKRKVNSSLYSLEQQQQLVQRKILQIASQIFWNSFGHITKCELSLEYASCLHSDFLSNFLFSIWKGEINLSQSIEILQSKQKRKSFINSQIKITGQISHPDPKSSKNSHLNQDCQIGKICSFPSSQIAEFGIYHIKLKSKRKSVHRRLSDKRSTIDTIIQESNPQRDVPPSFQSRSHQKKGRLFRHDAKRQSRSREKKSLTLLYQSDDPKHMTVNQKIRYESCKRQSQSSQRKKGSINPLDNFSFMKPSGRDKQTLDKGTLTVEGSYEKQQQSDQKGKNILRERLNSKTRFANEQIQGKHSLAKKSQATSSNNKHMSSAGLQNNMGQNRRNSMMWGSKNRRYLMLDNFLLDGKNETISKLIQNQKQILNLRNTSKSQQRQLLNRSQEKALQLFNKEIPVLSKSPENEEQLQSGSKARTVDIYQSKNIMPSGQSRNSRTHDTNDQFKFLLKNIKNNKQQNYRYSQENNFDGKDNNKTTDPRNFGVHSKQFVEKYFSPPKKKKSEKKHNKIEQNSFDQSKTMHIERISNEERKVDDKMFRSKFLSLLAKSSSNKQRKQQFRIVGVDAGKEKNILANGKVIRDDNDSSKELCSLATENNKSFQSASLILPVKCQNVDSNGKNCQTNQIENEYLLDEEQKLESNEKGCRFVDRSQKSLISAAKKLNSKMENKNFNMEDVFVEQEILSREQEKQRMLSKGMSQPEKQSKYETIQTIKQSFGQNERAQFDDGDIDLEDEDRPGSDTQNKSKDQSEFHDSHQSDIANKSKIQQKHILSELVGLISPIKNAELRKSQNPEFRKAQNNIQIVDQINHEENVAIIEKNQQKRQPQEKPKFTFKPKLTSSQDQNDQIGMRPFGKPSQPLESDELTNINIPTLKEDNLKPKMLQSQKQDQNQIEEIRTIERKPSISLKKKPSGDHNERKTVSFAETSKQKDQIPPKQAKEPKVQNQKNSIRKISVEQQFDLEQIKLIPTAKKETQNASKLVQPRQKQEQSEAASRNIRKASISETNKGSSSHRPPVSPGKKQEEPRLEQCEPMGTGKKSTENKREHTGQSSVASSYGPNKSVKKTVDEYIFMVNKIGEAVAKTPKVSKKIEGVTQWYVGVYFLYKRFLYERKKIEKYLKEGIPKLSRYDEEINLDEWNLYLKSKERQALLSKVSEENVNITKSIQKMQKKLLGRDIHESIKAHAAISQRSSRESCIAVDAVIDEFDTLVEKGMLQDEEISVHCSQMLNACLIVAELDQLFEEIVPITEYSKMKRTPQQLEDIAQDLYDLYHDE